MIAVPQDNNGNTLSESTASPAAITSYTWDRDNRLRMVTPPAPGLPTSYAYDANGLRIQRVDTTGNVNYLLDGPSVLEELDGVLATTTRYLNNPQALDDIVSFTKSGATYWPLTDALGSLYGVADSGGAMISAASYDAYGVRTVASGQLVTDVGHAGRWHDANGLIDHRQRQRQPQLGGWMSSDPLGFVNGPDTYLAFGARPVSVVDPTGLSYWSAFKREFIQTLIQDLSIVFGTAGGQAARSIAGLVFGGIVAEVFGTVTWLTVIRAIIIPLLTGGLESTVGLGVATLGVWGTIGAAIITTIGVTLIIAFALLVGIVAGAALYASYAAYADDDETPDCS